MSSEPNRVTPGASGLLSSALSSLQGWFAVVSMPVGGTAAARGESLVSSVSSALDGSGYVLPGGFRGRGQSGATIVESPSVGGSTIYEVMAGFRDQVISPVLEAQMVEHGNEPTFSTPTGPRRKGVTDQHMTRLLGNSLGELEMTVADPPLQRTRAQMALEQAMGGLGGSFQDASAQRSGLSFFGGVDETDGSLKQPIPRHGVGSSGGDAQVRLFQYDAKGVSFCGGLVSSKNKPKRFCISTSCGLGHGKKVFDQLKDGDYYIIESGARGGGLGQTLRAFLDPSLPRAAAEHSPDNKEVLKATNSMEGWLSLFRYLVDAEARGDGRGSNPELAGFASRARQSAFKTPLRENGTKRSSLQETWEDETEDTPPIALGLQNAIMGIQRGTRGAVP